MPQPAHRRTYTRRAQLGPIDRRHAPHIHCPLLSHTQPSTVKHSTQNSCYVTQQRETTTARYWWYVMMYSCWPAKAPPISRVSEYVRLVALGSTFA